MAHRYNATVLFICLFRANAAAAAAAETWYQRDCVLTSRSRDYKRDRRLTATNTRSRLLAALSTF